jgi:hypothetical protein
VKKSSKCGPTFFWQNYCYTTCEHSSEKVAQNFFNFQKLPHWRKFAQAFHPGPRRVSLLFKIWVSKNIFAKNWRKQTALFIQMQLKITITMIFKKIAILQNIG